MTSIGVASSAYNGCTQESLSVIASANNQINGNGYDPAGNMTSSSGVSYTYNAENQLTSTAGVTYTYDGDGKRVEKSNGTLYWYAGGSDPLAESNLTGGSMDEYIFFGGKRIAHHKSTGEIDYYAADHLGTSRIVVNSSGTILDDSDFYPFGGERPAIPPTSGNTFKFTGKERDPESNLDNFGARYDSSALGRFTSVDPVKITPGRVQDPQQLNLYSYVRNNPLRYLDPDGETLQVSGDVDTAEKQLCQLIGGDCDRISYNADTHTITVDLTGIDLSKNEGASLLGDVVASANVYNLDLGNSMLTAGGARSLAGDDAIQNLDRNSDWRLGNGKSANDLPAKGIDDQIGINPGVVFRDSKGKIVPLSSEIFHELAEAYAKVDEGKQYVNRDGSAGAHNEAVQRELTLRSQRPNMESQGRAGDQLIRDPKAKPQ